MRRPLQQGGASGNGITPILPFTPICPDGKPLTLDSVRELLDAASAELREMTAAMRALAQAHADSRGQDETAQVQYRELEAQRPALFHAVRLLDSLAWLLERRAA